LRERSDGRLDITTFPGAQMGPTPRYYDMARTGVVDLAWVLHGATPGRFPLNPRGARISQSGRNRASLLT
jgi:TRAP-type C4-dicarboxylate transport system substrate-binding protein